VVPIWPLVVSGGHASDLHGQGADGHGGWVSDTYLGWDPLHPG
jgi:hypothetical protein